MSSRSRPWRQAEEFESGHRSGGGRGASSRKAYPADLRPPNLQRCRRRCRSRHGEVWRVCDQGVEENGPMAGQTDSWIAAVMKRMKR